MITVDDLLRAVAGAAIDDENLAHFFWLSDETVETAFDSFRFVQYR
jgi:hypothetical protein